MDITYFFFAKTIYISLICFNQLNVLAVPNTQYVIHASLSTLPSLCPFVLHILPLSSTPVSRACLPFTHPIPSGLSLMLSPTLSLSCPMFTCPILSLAFLSPVFALLSACPLPTPLSLWSIIKRISNAIQREVALFFSNHTLIHLYQICIESQENLMLPMPLE